MLGGYWILKGKTLPGAAAAAGAYYAYKKGKKEGNSNDLSANGNVYPDSRYSYNDSSSGDVYPNYLSPSNSGSGSGILLK
ncbi:hypothetical protein D3C83_144000 [compost metagenome]